ncbi:hypothetical protein AYL99_01436 [Fonsecaea erecta]|uniref:Uncharacterized protein n=1 Tax=Fonsecaea erecta TaxID=1367422 RepID=A0A179A007_9EURO|nr:hypothetical protein AYL99_01436 [Fonsecaea erecta]OAP65464.1 hypothetical protein AYL99_01436 [Fonsecaea erecta]
MPRAPLRRRQLNRNGPVPHGAQKLNKSPAKLELEKMLANKPIGPRPNDSDDSDRLVVKGNGRRGRYVPRQEIYASGAVAAGDKPGNYPTRAQRRKNLAKATKEIIRSDQQEMRDEEGSVPVNKQLHQPKARSPTMNGILKNATDTNQVLATAMPLAARPSVSVPRALQPTPAREDSIIGALKPRRRQPSILQNLDQDSSSFDLEDEEEFLPDDESTPFGVSKLSNKVTPPVPESPILLSSTRKRKFGSSDPLRPVEIETAQKTMRASKSTPQPSFPAVTLSKLRESGRQHSEHVRDEDDIMALPQSSSSPAPSPVKEKSPAPIKSTKHPGKLAPLMTTKELQTHMMPTKRRRTERVRKQRRDTFDIPADFDLSESEISEDVSSFLPSKKEKKTRRNGPLKKAGGTRTKAKSGKAEKQDYVAPSSKARSKSKPSTNHLTTTTIPPILRPSTSNRETKSPSQHSTNMSSNINTGSQAGPSKPYGGSPHEGQGTVYSQDKENRHFYQSDPSPQRAEDAWLLDGTGEEVAGGGRNVHSKWAEIDAWDMDFEDVEVMTGESSSPTRW